MNGEKEGIKVKSVTSHVLGCTISVKSVKFIRRINLQ